MKQHGIGTLVVSLHEGSDPSFRWLSRGAAVTRGHVIVCRGADPLLVHYPMERDEAGSSGVTTRSAVEFGYPQLFARHSSPADAWSAFFSRILLDLDAPGPIAFAGTQPLHLYAPVMRRLAERGFRIFEGDGSDLLQRARRRKSAGEVAAIAEVGRRTEQVVASVRELLRNVSIREGEAWAGAERLTVGRLKDLISNGIVAGGMIEDHETIVTQGREAGVPHSRGTRSEPVRASVPLVIDIFPRDRHSGWFFDLSRTFCIGEIPPRLAEVHALVREAHSRALRNAAAGVSCAQLQRDTCAFFREAGWPTIEESPATLRGYVHGLGHGVGLEVHELPSFALSSMNSDVLEPGDVFTIEPGLYDPDEELGVRIEDTCVVHDDGSVRSLSSSDRGLEP